MSLSNDFATGVLHVLEALGEPMQISTRTGDTRNPNDPTNVVSGNTVFFDTIGVFTTVTENFRRTTSIAVGTKIAIFSLANKTFDPKSGDQVTTGSTVYTMGKVESPEVIGIPIVSFAEIT